MICGYITASTTELARVVLHNNTPHLVNHKKFANKDFSNFDSVLSLYLRKTKGERKVACFGVAGPVINNTVTATNLPWKISGSAIAKDYPFQKVTIINDLVASAYGLFLLGDDKIFEINKGKKIKNGNMGLVAAGTGLGNLAQARQQLSIGDYGQLLNAGQLQQQQQQKELDAAYEQWNKKQQYPWEQLGNYSKLFGVGTPQQTTNWSAS